MRFSVPPPLLGKSSSRASRSMYDIKYAFSDCWQFYMRSGKVFENSRRHHHIHATQEKGVMGAQTYPTGDVNVIFNRCKEIWRAPFIGCVRFRIQMRCILIRGKWAPDLICLLCINSDFDVNLIWNLCGKTVEGEPTKENESVWFFGRGLKLCGENLFYVNREKWIWRRTIGGKNFD